MHYQYPQPATEERQHVDVDHIRRIYRSWWLFWWRIKYANNYAIQEVKRFFTTLIWITQG